MTYLIIAAHPDDEVLGCGGSPLRNLIVRGYKSTMIFAIKCVEEVDSVLADVEITRETRNG